MKRLVRICCDYNKNIEDALIDVKIKYERYQEANYDWLIFYLDRDAQEYDVVLKAIEDAHMPGKPTMTKSLSFTKEELDNAEWLTVRPICKKIDTYDDRFCFNGCQGVGKWTCFSKRRTYPMYCNKPIKWGKNHYFYASYECGYIDMYCSDAARKILHENKVPLVYETLYWKNMEPVPDVHHIIPLNTLPTEAFDLGHMEVLSDCPVCGIKVYGWTGFAQLKIDGRFLHSDILAYGTLPIFGPLFASPVMIISQECRKIILEHRMERGLEFQPIIVF